MKQNNNIKVAVIDLGTLKIKFEVREYKRDGSWSVILKQKVLTVLARNLDKNQGMIHRKSIENTINVLKGFMKSLNDMNIKQYEAVTTEVIRKARNSQTVLQEIYERTGIRFNVLGHKEEGEIYFRSVSHDFPNKNIAVVDVGGGSVQVVLGKNKDIYETYYFPTGAYFLQEAFFKTHHPTLDELECAKRYVSDVLRPLKNSKFMPDLLIYGSSNIIDFLQAMKVLLVKNNSREHPYKVHIDTLYALYEKLIGMCYEDRMPLYQAEPYYMWSAEKALLNVFQICENLGISTVIPSNNNISSGILYDLAYGSKK